MNEAELYKRSNILQRRDAQQVISEFSHLLHWREDGCDSLMDVGCGSGDVTIDFVLPIMPKHFSRLVGTDISHEMIKFAENKYSKSNIAFDELDISADITKYLNSHEQFDHIVSFYCFHWIQNQKRAVQNIHNLLSPGGDCLLVFLAKNPIFEIYKELSKCKRWEKYMKDVDRFISPFQNAKDPADEFGSLLYNSGFSEFSVEIREKLFVYDGVEILKSLYSIQ